jgi:hypothetical protein
MAIAKPFGEAFPALSEALERSRGRPKLDAAKDGTGYREIILFRS